VWVARSMLSNSTACSQMGVAMLSLKGLKPRISDVAGSGLKPGVPHRPSCMVSASALQAHPKNFAVSACSTLAITHHWMPRAAPSGSKSTMPSLHPGPAL
jgi:hypothetical protein